MAHVILVSVSSPKTPFIYLGMPLKNASYLVTLSKKVGGGQDLITISGPLEIGGRWEEDKESVSLFL